MNKSIKDDIETKLGILIGQPLIDLGRAGNLLWVAFGEKIDTLDWKGIPIEKCKYYLNIQCSWRLTKGDSIIVASRDIYMPRTGIYDKNFEWDEIGANRFDERASMFKKDFLSNLKVSEIHADCFGGCKISLDFGIEIEIFPDDSLVEEFWRFIMFDNSSNSHFVVFEKE